jgi:hypothetical protein
MFSPPPVRWLRFFVRSYVPYNYIPLQAWTSRLVVAYCRSTLLKTKPSYRPYNLRILCIRRMSRVILSHRSYPLGTGIRSGDDYLTITVWNEKLMNFFTHTQAQARMNVPLIFVVRYYNTCVVICTVNWDVDSWVWSSSNTEITLYVTTCDIIRLVLEFFLIF